VLSKIGGKIMVIIALITALVLIGVDQAIKQWALDTLAQVDTIPLIQDESTCLRC